MNMPDSLPAGLLHTRQLASQSVHTELVSCHAEVTENTLSLASSNASVLDLGGAGVAVHLRQLQLSLSARALWQKCVADDVAKCLSLGLVLLKDFALGVVADDLDVDETTKVQLLRSEHGHDCGVVCTDGRISP